MSCMGPRMVGEASHHRLVAMGSFVVLLASVSAAGEAWLADGKLELSSEYSDNRQLEISDPDDGVQNDLELVFGVERNTKNLQFRAEASGEFVRYSGFERLEDEDNQELSFAGSYQPNRRVQYDFVGAYERDTTSNRLIRLDDVDVESLPFETDLALTREQFRVERTRVSPSVQWRLTRRWSALASYSYNESELPEAAIDFGFFDFDRHAANIGLRYEFDQKNSLAVLATGSSFRSDSAFEDANSETLGGTVQFRSRVTENLSLQVVEAAASQSLDGVTIASSDDTLVTFGGFVNRRGESARFTFNFDREIRPSGVGRLLQTDTVRANYSYRVAPRHSLVFRATYLRNRSTGPDPESRLDRDFLTLQPGWRWRLTPLINVGANYRYRVREQALETESVDGNAFVASFEYNFGNWRFN